MHLILRVCREEFAIIVSSNDDSPQGCWVFRGNDIGEGPLTIWCIPCEAVFFDMPVQSSQCSSDVSANQGAVIAPSCWCGMKEMKQRVKINNTPGRGIRIFDR